MGLCDLWNVVPGKPSWQGSFIWMGITSLEEPFRSVWSAARGSVFILKTRLILGVEEKKIQNELYALRENWAFCFGGRPALWGSTLNCYSRLEKPEQLCNSGACQWNGRNISGLIWTSTASCGSLYTPALKRTLGFGSVLCVIQMVEPCENHILQGSPLVSQL